MMKNVNNLIIIIISIISVKIGIIKIVDNNIIRSLISFSVIPVMLLPYTLRKRLKLNDIIIFIYLIFIFFSHFLGSILSFYELFSYYDKIMHFMSGILTSVLAIFLLISFKNYNKNNLLFNIIFIISITLAIASLWEFFEYISDSIFNGNAQRVLSTGVSDTMQDMIAAFLGSIFFIIFYILKRGANINE